MSLRSVRRRRCVAIILAAAIVTSGCTKTRVEKLARYPIGGDAVEQPVPFTGVYTVRWSDGRTLHELKPTARVLRKGVTVGFAPTTNRSPVAIAGDERIELSGLLPPSAVQCLWYHRSTEPTRLTMDVFQGGKWTAETTVLVVIVGTVLAAAVAYLIWVRSVEDQ